MSTQVNFLTINPSEALPEGFPDDGDHSGAEWVKFAQRFYSGIVKFIEDEDWPTNPVGNLAVHWNVARGQSATRLINLAFALNQLLGRVPSDRRQLLKPKIAALFRSSSELVFEENLAELEVGAVLACNFEQFSLEPLVPTGPLAGHEKPASPDYGVELPEGLVLVDATVWHWEHLSAWHRAVGEINTRLFKHIDKRGVARDVLLHLPNKAPSRAVEVIASREICAKIAELSTGEEILDVGASCPARICWTEYEPPSPPRGWNPASIPRFTEPPIDPALVVDRHRYVRVSTRFPGPPRHGLLHLAAELCLTEDDVQDGLASLQVALRRKKRQASARQDLPYLIAVHLYSGAAKWDEFSTMVENRLWPNSRFAWLSGILAHEPMPARLSGPPTSGPNSLFWIPNPNADVPVPQSMLNGAT